MLALRLPARAGYMFDLAYLWFRNSNDHVSEFITGVCIALAQARLGKMNALSATLQSIGRIYPGGDITALSWQGIKDIAGSITSEQLDNLNPTIWRPWIVRLLA